MTSILARSDPLAQPPTRALQGPGPDRREWWVGGWATSGTVQRGRCTLTTHSTLPCREGYGARFAVRVCLRLLDLACR